MYGVCRARFEFATKAVTACVLAKSRRRLTFIEMNEIDTTKIEHFHVMFPSNRRIYWVDPMILAFCAALRIIQMPHWATPKPASKQYQGIDHTQTFVFLESMLRGCGRQLICFRTKQIHSHIWLICEWLVVALAAYERIDIASNGTSCALMGGLDAHRREHAYMYTEHYFYELAFYRSGRPSSFSRSTRNVDGTNRGPTLRTTP